MLDDNYSKPITPGHFPLSDSVNIAEITNLYCFKTILIFNHLKMVQSLTKDIAAICAFV